MKNTLIEMPIFDRTTTGFILSAWGVKITEFVKLISWGEVLTNTLLAVSIILGIVNITYKISLMKKNRREGEK